jgi:AraC-like DNA-binding protein/mannose-6-phosphate isomerase-like protein (cupin superfamily)
VKNLRFSDLSASAIQKISSEKALKNFAVRLLHRWITGFDEGTIGLRIPKMIGLMTDVPGMRFHLRPELFFQISGITKFEFPEEAFDVFPGEICLVPTGMPHLERVRPYQNEPFLNFMFGYSEDHFAFHLAREQPKGEPVGFVFSKWHVTPLDERLGILVERFHREGTAKSLSVKSALLDHLFTLLHSLEGTPLQVESRKVGRINDLLRQELPNSDLSVNWIARHLKLSPDYVSRLYRKDTGESLAAAITYQRIHRARYLLEVSSLNIAEISRAVGFSNPNYFTQLFCKYNKIPPRQYRLEHARD